MRPAYIRREPLVYWLLRQIWHDERVKDALALVAVGVWLGYLFAVGVTQ